MSALPHHTADAKSQIAAPVVPNKAAEFDVDSAIHHFEVTADGLEAQRPPSGELTKIAYELAALTRELFPGSLAIETGIDPEIRNDVCLLFQVEASGSEDEILARHDRWHRRVVSIAPKWPGLFRLSIDASPRLMTTAFDVWR